MLINKQYGHIETIDTDLNTNTLKRNVAAMAEKMLTEIVHVYSQTRFQSKMLSFMKA